MEKTLPLLFCTGAVAIFIICGGAGNSNSFAFRDKNILYEGESIYKIP